MTEAVVVLDRVVKAYHLGSRRHSLRAAVPGRWGERVVGDTHRALDGLSCTVQAGSSFGIVGPNGAGKSTLLKLVAGVLAPTSGRVAVRGRVAALIELGAGLHPELTGRENVRFLGAALGMRRREMQRRSEEIYDFADIDAHLDTPVKQYSSGMVARLGFAVASHLDAEVLVVDEVLAVGDAAFQRRCHERMQTLRGLGTTLLYVTHALWTLPLLCERAVVLSGGRIAHEGSPLEVLEAYRRSQALDRTVSGSDVLDVQLTTPQTSPGGELRATVSLIVPAEAPNPHLLVSITDESGVILAGWERPVEGVGGATAGATLRIPSLPLQPGHYALHVCLTHHAGDTVCEHLTRRDFEVTGTAHNREAFGAVAMQTSWEWSDWGGAR